MQSFKNFIASLGNAENTDRVLGSAASACIVEGDASRLDVLVTPDNSEIGEDAPSGVDVISIFNTQNGVGVALTGEFNGEDELLKAVGLAAGAPAIQLFARLSDTDKVRVLMKGPNGVKKIEIEIWKLQSYDRKFMLDSRWEPCVAGLDDEGRYKVCRAEEQPSAQ